jgi:hypothetical protein
MQLVKSSRDVIIRTDRWTEAVRHYEITLGFPVISRNGQMVGFDTGAFRLYVEPGAAHGPVFEYLVDDVDATKQQLIAAGCTIVEEDPSVPRCYLCDPFGVTFNLGRT